MKNVISIDTSRKSKIGNFPKKKVHKYKGQKQIFANTLTILNGIYQELEKSPFHKKKTNFAQIH